MAVDTKDKRASSLGRVGTFWLGPDPDNASTATQRQHAIGLYSMAPQSLTATFSTESTQEWVLGVIPDTWDTDETNDTWNTGQYNDTWSD